MGGVALVGLGIRGDAVRKTPISERQGTGVDEATTTIGETRCVVREPFPNYQRESQTVLSEGETGAGQNGNG